MSRTRLRRGLLIGLVTLALIAGPIASPSGATSIVVDPLELKDILSLFHRSDVVALVFILDAVQDGKPVTQLAVHGHVNKAFKGVLNDSVIKFRCIRGCTPGERYLVFLDRADKVRGGPPLIGEKAEPPRPQYVTADDFLISALHSEVPYFLVTFDCYDPRPNTIVVLPSDRLGIPSSIQQGPLKCINHGRGCGVDLDQFADYLTQLAIDENGPSR